jgi:hypothetical protein
MNTSIFKRKPALRKPPPVLSPDGDEDDSGFFSRGNDAFKKRAADIARNQEEEARQKRENARKQEEAEAALKREEELGEHGEHVTQNERHKDGRSKRQRSSRDNEDETEDTPPKRRSSTPRENSSRPPSSHEFKSPSKSSQKSTRPPKVLMESYTDSVAARKKSTARQQTIVIDCEDDDRDSAQPQPKDEDLNATQAKPALEPEGEYEPEIDSDPELAEIQRRAREKARRRKLQQDTPESSIPNTARPDARGMLSPGTEDSSSIAARKDLDDPVVQYLVTSSRINTKAVIIERRFSQRLKEVRLTWCQRQSFTDEFTRDVLLTYKGERVYDTTACRSLGSVVVDGQIVNEEDGHSGQNRIHLVAMTQDDYREAQKEKERRAQAAAATKEDAYHPPPVLEEPKEDNNIKLVLRSKGLEDFKCKPKLVSSSILLD